LLWFLWPERDEKMGLLKAILSGEALHFADCAVNAGKVDLPASFRKAYPGQNRIHVTNHFYFRERCLLLLTPAQFEEVAAELRAAPKERNVELFTTFFIGGAQEVSIINGTLLVPKPLHNFLGAYLGQPETATLCWLPGPSAAIKARSPGKTARRRVLVPA
jgi:hypothetical protein